VQLIFITILYVEPISFPSPDTISLSPTTIQSLIRGGIFALECIETGAWLVGHSRNILSAYRRILSVMEDKGRKMGNLLVLENLEDSVARNIRYGEVCRELSRSGRKIERLSREVKYRLVSRVEATEQGMGYVSKVYLCSLGRGTRLLLGVFGKDCEARNFIESFNGKIENRRATNGLSVEYFKKELAI